MNRKRPEPVAVGIARLILSGQPITAAALSCSRTNLALLARRLRLVRVRPFARKPHYIGPGLIGWARARLHAHATRDERRRAYARAYHHRLKAARGAA